MKIQISYFLLQGTTFVLQKSCRVPIYYSVVQAALESPGRV